jgi:GNAT superfamily N-acetyltransferase
MKTIRPGLRLRAKGRFGGRVRLRPARDADGPAVTALVRRSLRGYRLRFDPAGIDRPLRAPSTHYRGPGRRFWVLEAGGRVIGTVAVDRRDRRTAELMKMYLDRRWRGQGLGRRLLRVALAFARRAGYRRVLLETNARLREARALYEKAGFRLHARKRIPPRCDAVYVKTLA